MKTIWKFSFPIADEFSFEMPVGAQILSVQVQNGPSGENACLWALVDPSAPREDRAFRIRGTGHDAAGIDAETFIGTFQMLGGSLVWHLFNR